MKARNDALTGDLFTAPVPTAPLPGALDFSLAVRRLLSDAIKASPHNAHWIAARMTELIGQPVSEHQVHAWTAPSREGWRFPLEYLPAFEAAAEGTLLTRWLCGVRGGEFNEGKEVYFAELGRQERIRDEAARKIKQLKNVMGEEA